MMWGAIGANGGYVLSWISGSITAVSYCETLREDLLHSATVLLPVNFIFQQDNAPVHNARVTKQFLLDEHVNVMEWPPYSPDLNPIENVWAEMSKRVYAGGRGYTTEKELWEACVAAWHALPIEFFRNIYNSMSNRLVEVLLNRGERIKY